MRITETTWVPLGIAASVAAVVLAIGISWGNIATKVEQLREDVSDIKSQIAEIRTVIINQRDIAFKK